jgi:methionyl-tRNA formyltransferase
VIGPTDTVGRVYQRLNEVQRTHLGRVVEGFLGGDAGVPQAEVEATYCCARTPADGEIDWSAPTARVYNLIRALTPPFPGAFTYYEGHPLRVCRAEVPAAPRRFVDRVPGRVVAVSMAGGFVEVLTGDGVLRVLQVQRPGEEPRPAPEVITSVRGTLGLRVSDLLRRIGELEERLAARE